MYRNRNLLILVTLAAACSTQPGDPSTGSVERAPSWAELEDKPSVFPPSAHEHAWDEIADKPGAFLPMPHTHEGEDGGLLPISTVDADDGNTVSFLQDKRLHLRTRHRWVAKEGHLSDLIRLQWTAPRAKPALTWIDETGAAKAALVTHREANNPMSEDHRHFSIETTMDPDGAFAGQLFTRMEFPFDEDIAEIQVHSARFTMNGNFLRVANEEGASKEIRLSRRYSVRTRPDVYPDGVDENGVGIGMPDYDRMYSTRWAIRSDGSAEEGANTGSDFRIVRFDDEGTALDSPLFIERTTGAVGVMNTTPTSALDVNGDAVRIRHARTPRDSSDPMGAVGDISWDEGYVYVKTNAGWRRSRLEAF